MRKSVGIRVVVGLVCSFVVGGCVTLGPPGTPSGPATAPTTSTARPPTPRVTEQPTAQPTSLPTPALPTEQPTPSPTEPPTPSPEASAPAGSPPPVGNEIFRDDMSAEIHYLSTGTQEDFGTGEYADGVFRITAEPRPGFVNYGEGGSNDGCSGDPCLPPHVLNNQLVTASVEVDATQVSGALDGGFGIACAFEGTGVIGGFTGNTISADGRRYAIARNAAPGELPLDHLIGGADRGEPHAAINQGLGATNHLRADCGEQVFSFWVNGTLVASGSLPEPLGEIGYQRGVAIIAAPGPDEEVVVEFDNLVVSELLAEPALVPQSGLPIYLESLVRSPAFLTGEFEVGSTEFAGGGYVVRPARDNRAAVFPTTMVSPIDVTVQVDILFDSGHELMSAGVQCRGGSTGWYTGEIRFDGAFSIAREGLLGTERLVDWTPTSAIEPGFNTVRLECVGDTLTLFVNDEEVGEVTDSELTEPGSSGLQATSPEQATDEPEDEVVVRFSLYEVRHP